MHYGNNISMISTYIYYFVKVDFHEKIIYSEYLSKKLRKKRFFYYNPEYMNQKLLNHPNRTTIIKNPGAVNPSNNPKTQKHIEPIDR